MGCIRFIVTLAGGKRFDRMNHRAELCVSNYYTGMYVQREVHHLFIGCSIEGFDVRCICWLGFVSNDDRCCSVFTSGFLVNFTTEVLYNDFSVSVDTVAWTYI
jgi:hypothetical protein